MSAHPPSVFEIIDKYRDISLSDEEYSSRVIKMMKTFNVPLDSVSTDLPDLLEVQSIMREGKIHDLAKCIQNVLNYNLNASSNNTNTIRVLDPSFVTLFHIAQFMIKFLLFWKTNLFNDNVKLQNQFQELEKLRKDYQLKKLEARELRKQLSTNLRSKNAAVPECSQCRKVFVNDTYLYAHHKRRHGDQPFVSNRNDIQILQNEIKSVKQQLMDVQGNSPTKLMKMKLVPEIGCLESQEKYWKGRMKELYDAYEEEKTRLKRIIGDLEIENARLNRKLNSETKSVQTQTEFSSGIAHSKYFEPKKVEQSSSSSLMNGDLVHEPYMPEPMCRISPSIFPRWSSDTHRQPQSPPSRKDNDIVDQVDSFLVNYNRRRETEAKKKPMELDFLSTSSNDVRREEVRKVISKIFSTDESSEELAEKLIRIYDKRGSLMDEHSFELNLGDNVPVFASIIEDSKEDETSFECGSTSPVTEYENTPSFESDPKVMSETQPTETSSLVESVVAVTKPKSKFFPFLKNIPTKIMKNYTKSRRACAEVVEDKIINRLSHQSKKSDSTEVKEISNPVKITTDEEIESEQASKNAERNPKRSLELESESKPSGIELISALKKSKSTGNLVKKVMFADQLPTVRTNSESELSRCKASESRNVVGTIDVHYDKFALPIPAPRARKNIVSVADANQQN